jgi:cysteinyl-tRNA synthetase
MSKSKGNIYYTEDLLAKGYTVNEIRFFLIYGHYRKKLNCSEGSIRQAADKLRKFRAMVDEVEATAIRHTKADDNTAQTIEKMFSEKMDDDLDVKSAFDQLYDFFSKLNVRDLNPAEASGFKKGLKDIDEVLKVIY